MAGGSPVQVPLRKSYKKYTFACTDSATHFSLRQTAERPVAICVQRLRYHVSRCIAGQSHKPKEMRAMIIWSKGPPGLLGLGLVGLGLVGLGLLSISGCSPPENLAPGPAALPDISISGTGIFPESLTSSADGSVYIGSIGKAQIYKVAPGAAIAEPFIMPGSGGIRQVFGVFADDGSGTLWACSNDGSSGPSGASALHSFDLASGAAKASYPFPAGGFCNDIAVGPNGDVYATDTHDMQILRLPHAGVALEVWSAAGAFGPPAGALDGIAVISGRVIVGTIGTGKLFAVQIGADGKAGAVTELKLSAKLIGPDGMRAYGGDGVLLTDAKGKVSHVVIRGDTATLTTVKKGLKGLVSVTVVGRTAYALEGQLAIRDAQPGTKPPTEVPYRAVAFNLP